MKVYIKNIWGQQTIRDLPIFKALKLRVYTYLKYQRSERPIIKFLI